MGTHDRPDTDEAAQSLANLAEILIPLLDAVQARSVVEVGAYQGDLTRELLGWAVRRGARVAAIEPRPTAELLEVAAEHPELELVRERSHEALSHIPAADAVIVDGDHNYYTVSEELRLIDARAPAGALPLLMLHDVGWPHARRDTYYAPEEIPEEHRQPVAHNATLAPWEPGVADGGIPYGCVARQEGGPRNGVLTAIEDFLDGREDLRLAIVPAFFGLGLLWHQDAPWASAVAALVEPRDRDPVLARLEANRVKSLAERYRDLQELQAVGAMRGELARHTRQEQLLRSMLTSRAFTWGEWLSRLRKGGRPAFSREAVKRALGSEDRR